MGRTKVVGPAGRYGPRYGVSVRKRVRDILARRYQPHECPFCGSTGTVRRVSVGVWSCRKCGNTWAGAAYTPRSGLAKYFKRYIVRG
ncbi:50S ribosomal protein L37Ae [Aeropyrum pernix K1]|uniref:Large ribosomal subunit protein eL43 n=2 Tax=Aeropyrum pernix TaxID=56636 RepID=RL37A_AERPE|nr:50S ribosomal protein L37ae [Aeropyrum pernix]Q9YC06.1 RecName: Full=Large ribosomal subunit protein eL43; AltName: Full=50S ribosomal protein L37Ae; AltName: Full=Ribosomal protein L43e [Aeropyrum pernix K1]BAA80442.1 50S ribosomal protein L37Ae [Aeropyrum pernix K1]GBF08674.1 50S ribosomal protein L37Ae [Aeropyrum pernix]